MPEKNFSIALVAAAVPLRTKPSNYPEPFATRMSGREKRPLGDLFGLTNFGVNLTRLPPGAVSALRHAHTKQDEFIYILEGSPRAGNRCGRNTPFAGHVRGLQGGYGRCP